MRPSYNAMIFFAGLTAFLVGLFEAREASAQAKGGTIALSTTLLEVGPRQRTALVSLANRTNTVQRYRVSVIDMVMDSTGEVAAIAKDAPSHERSASSWVIATPRSVRLAPGQSQNIRLLIRRPRGLPDGEYRAHLRVAQEPPADIAGGLSNASHSDNMTFNLVTVYSTSIPVVIKQGRVASKVSLVNARFVDQGKKLAVTVKHRGNASFRGFALATIQGQKPIYMPITVYPECDEVTRRYALGALADSMESVNLTLYEGALGQDGTLMTAKVLETHTVRR